MRDYVEEQLAHKLLTEEQYESACPICCVCGNHITASEYFYDIDGTFFCDNYDCVNGFLQQYRRRVISYVENGR
jgi:hypothetical protein